MAANGDAIFLGLRLYELLTLLGIVTGPIVAVLVTIWSDGRRQDRDQRTQLLRMLLNTRGMPADPAYSTAINLVPVEFRHREDVLLAWHHYIDAVRYTPTPENSNAHNAKVTGKQTSLIFQMMKSLDINISETDIETEGYLSQGFVKRDNLYIDFLKVTRQMADALKKQNALTEALVVRANTANSKS